MAIPRPHPTNDDRIRAALWFAERGFRVFSVWSTDDDGVCQCRDKAACQSPGKHPIPPRGLSEATTDEKRIRTMLSAASNPNYGLVPPEGVFVLDVDGEGVARLVELEALHGPLPATLRTATAHGSHIYLRWPERLPRPIGNLWGYVTRWGTGSHVGYVIGPRSVHPTGAEYQPAAGSAWEIAELPDAWARSVVGRPEPEPFIVVGGTGYQLPERVAAGASRYGAILAYTAHLYNTSRLGPAEMWPLVRDVLAPRFDEALTEPEIRARFDRVVDKMAERLGERRGLPPVPIDPSSFPQPEDRGLAELSVLGLVEYVEDLVRPGRIVVWAAEEGSGKSYTVTGELAIRMATIGGDFAGTWPVLHTGRVLVLSEMHPDDDFVREDIVLHSLGLQREALHGRYFRLDLMTAAGGRPALTVPEWRAWITQWLDEREVLLLVVDTATGATQVDPWGREIQAVYSALRVMIAEYPAIAVILIVHLKKPESKGDDRGISDVLGEWGRWCDVVVLQENDGLSLDRARVTTRKRVRRQRRVVATKQGGLLVDPIDLEGGLAEAKVPVHDILEAIGKHPDISYGDLAKELGVSRDTVSRYAAGLGARVVVSSGPRGSKLVRLADSADSASGDLREVSQDIGATVRNSESGPPQTTARADATVRSGGRRTVAATPPSKEGEGVALRQSDSAGPGLPPPELTVVRDADDTHVRCHFFADHQTRHLRRDDGSYFCPICEPPEETA